MRLLPLMLLALAFWLSKPLEAQMRAGSSGLLNIPVGEIHPDKTFSAGLNYLPVGQVSKSFGGNTANYFFNLSFLPFTELTYRLTLFAVHRKGNFTQQDRSFNVKFRLLKEQKILPSLLAGMEDIYSSGSGEGNQYFASSYVVSTKTLSTRAHIFRLTAGYGYNYKSRASLDGVFGGLSYSPKRFSNVTLLAEYDTRHFNFAGTVLLWKHLFIYGGYYGTDEPAAGLAYRIHL